MRKVLGMVLLFLGGFLLVAAALSKFYAADAVRRTPLDINVTSRLEGTAAIGSDAETPVRATNTTRTDSAKSDGKVVVFKTSTCLVKVIGDTPDCVSADDPQQRLVSVSTDNFATDRKTAEAVNDPKYLPADATVHKGLVNKFPFDTKKKNYQYWNGDVNQVTTAVYTGTADVQGVQTYKFTADVADAPIEIAAGMNGRYTDHTEIWVEPVTGSILRQTDSQKRVTDTGSSVLDLNVIMTPATSKTLIDDAKKNKNQLKLVDSTLPIVGLIVGLLALLGGLLAVRDNRSGEHSREHEVVAA